MSTQGSSVGRSQYRQLRLTVTHELNGRFSYSLYGKPLNKEWHEHQCMGRGAVDGTLLGLNSTEDVVMAMITVLEEHFMLRPTDDR